MEIFNADVWAADGHEVLATLIRRYVTEVLWPASETRSRRSDALGGELLLGGRGGPRHPARQPVLPEISTLGRRSRTVTVKTMPRDSLRNTLTFTPNCAWGPSESW